MSIKINNLTHIYMPGTPFEKVALDNVNLEIKDGDFVAIIGHTGSGKSTLIQHINGLLEPSSGEIIIDGEDITKNKTSLLNVRKKVGLVFQYPEYQLFEETIAKDIAFGPKNLGLSDKEISKIVRDSMAMVGLDYDKYKDKSPFELSGGQKRRVAIAGVVAMKPRVLILDEPTAGLDPKGREEIFRQIRKLHDEYDLTIVIVSHSMEDVANIANTVVVMNNGTVVLNDKTSEVFKHVDLLKSIGLGVPEVTTLMHRLKDKGFNVSTNIYTIQQAKKEILRVLNRKSEEESKC